MKLVELLFCAAGAALILYVLVGFAEPDERVMLPRVLAAHGFP